MTVRRSTGSCGSSAPGWPGVTCPSGTARGPRCTPAFAGGTWTARSRACSGPSGTDLGHPYRFHHGGELGAVVGVPARHGEVERAACPCPGRQGPQLQSHPHLAAMARHQPHRPGAGRPDPQPAPTRQPRRTPASLRQATLQAAQRGRTLPQPLEATARHRATRYDKTPESYLAGLHLRGAVIWIRSLRPTP